MLTVTTAAVEQGSSMNSRPIPPGRMMIDVETVAHKLGVDKRSVFRWADSKRIPFGVKLGSRRLWDLSQLDAFIAGGCRHVGGAK